MFAPIRFHIGANGGVFLGWDFDGAEANGAQYRAMLYIINEIEPLRPCLAKFRL